MEETSIPKFKDLEGLTEFVIKNANCERINEIIAKSCKLLFPALTDSDLDNVIQHILSKVEENRGKTEEDYKKDLMAKIQKEGKITLAAAKNFLKENMMAEKKDFVEAFILENFGMFFKQIELKNVLSFYKSEKKLEDKGKKLRAENAARAAKVVRANEAAEERKSLVDAEFDGLYTLKIGLSGDPFAIPHIDEIAKRVIKNLNVINYSGNLFCYTQTNGYYKNDTISVKTEATRILNGICKETGSNGIKKHLEDVMTIVKNTNPQDTYPFNNYDNAIPVKNGVIVIDFEKNEYALEKSNPEKWKFNYKLPVIFKEDLINDCIINELKKYTSKKVVTDTDEEVYEETDEYKMLIQAIAQALLQAMGYGPYKKAYLLKGSKNCGKTTFLDFTECIIGESSKSKVALSELTPQFRFTRAEMEGKLMNIDDDLGYFKMSETGVFKKLTGGYSQKIERKGVDPYDVKMTAVHMFTTNTPAGFDHRIFIDDAFWDRWVYIEFNRVFEKDDEFKKRVLTEENVSGFFNEILKMMMEIRKEKRLPYVQNWLEVRNRWMQESNVLYKFIEENMVAGGRTAIIKDDLLHAVEKFCLDKKLDNALVPQTVNALGNLVEICGGSKDDQRSFINSDDRVNRCFVLNYTWIPLSPYKMYAKEEKAQVSKNLVSRITENNSIKAYAGN